VGMQTAEVFDPYEMGVLLAVYGPESEWPAWLKYPSAGYANTAPDNLIFEEGDTPIIASGTSCSIAPIVYLIVIGGTPASAEGDYLARPVYLFLTQEGVSNGGEWIWKSHYPGLVDYTVDLTESDEPMWTLTRNAGTATLTANMVDGTPLDAFTWEVTGDWDCFGDMVFTRVSESVWPGVVAAVVVEFPSDAAKVAVLQSREQVIAGLMFAYQVNYIPEANSSSDSLESI